MVDAVLLEWEGVLADTGAARREALLRALADEGVLWNAAAYEACCGGLDVYAAASAALGDAGHDDATLTDLVALRASRAFLEHLAQGFSLQPGAARFIAEAEHRARVAIVTRAARAETEIVLGLSGLESAIACIVTTDDVPAPPSASDSYERALAQLARRRIVQPHRSVALIDTTPAVRAARGAGLRTLAIGAPAHVAMDADAASDSFDGLTMNVASSLVGVAVLERPA
jgi:beta-phosphoglucomutase-like phosphatase (HAD superfamily)